MLVSFILAFFIADRAAFHAGGLHAITTICPADTLTALVLPWLVVAIDNLGAAAGVTESVPRNRGRWFGR